jgi:hypothetical protein
MCGNAFLCENREENTTHLCIMACFNRYVAEGSRVVMLGMLSGIGSPLEVRRELDAEAKTLEEVDPRTAGALLRVGTAEELLHWSCLLSKDGRELIKES